jgi:ATP-dependent DNA helicase RecG
MVLTLEESIRRGRVDDPGTREPLEILRGLGLLVDGDKVSRAAVVLFCADDAPLPDFSQLLLKVARFKGTTRDEFLDNRQFHGNAFSLMRRAERFLIDSLPVASRIVPGRMEREDTPLLPVEALREALANAFVHRDYSVGGGSVNVALYEDRLEIISIGDLHFGLTPEALFREHESKPWNPMIARTFYRRGIIETWGRGTLKIARLMQERGLEPPAVAVRQGAVVITFVLPAPVKTPEKTETLQETPQETPQKTPQKTPDAIVAILRQRPAVSFAEVAAKLGKSESAIKRAVRKLRESGRLARIGPDKGGHWQVIE